MAITNGYTTLATLKTRLGISDTADDTLLESIVEGVSRQIDEYTCRRFFAVSETRTYVPAHAGCVLVDDLLSSSPTIALDLDGDGTFETTLSASDYVLGPYNAVANGRPFWRIEVAPLGRYALPTGYRSVQVIGSFGFCALASCPKPVESACLFQAGLEYQAKDAPAGVSGGGDFDAPLRAVGLHPFAKRILESYRIVGVA